MIDRNGKKATRIALFSLSTPQMRAFHIAHHKGLDARTTLLFALMIGEGCGLLWFSRTDSAATAIVAMITFGLFTHMACGATYALVPFIDRKALGGVAGIVGAGGNVGAVAAGFLLKAVGSVADCFAILGGVALFASGCALAVRFTPSHKAAEQELYERALAERASSAGTPALAR